MPNGLFWQAKKKRWAIASPESENIEGNQKGSKDRTGERGGGKSAWFPFSATNGNGAVGEEISENQVNVATRQVNLSDILGKMPGWQE